MKTCPSCSTAKPFDQFHKESRRKDGFAAYCRACTKQRAALYYEANKERILARNKEWQKSDPERRRASAKKYRDKTKDRQNAYQREWREKNPGKASGYTAKWRAKVGNERVLQDAKRYREANRDKARESSLRWQRENPAFAAANNAARYAAKLKATPKWANLNAIAEFYKEAERLAAVYFRPYHVDHIVPLRNPLVCGLHCEANLRVIPADENRSKGNRWWPDMP